MSQYPGAASYLTPSPVNWANAVALAQLPNRPLRAADLPALRTLHEPAPLAWSQDAAQSVSDGLAVLSCDVTFLHPPGAPPQQIVALALLSPEGGQFLAWLMELSEVKATEKDGDEVNLTVQLLSLVMQDVAPA